MLTLALFGACKDEQATNNDTTDATPVSNVPAPVQIPFTVIAEYPHNHTAFTEGLQYADGIMYESTGLRGKSVLTKTDLQTGKELQRIQLDGKYFGEGITVLNGKIYQLTYEEKTGFVYDAKTLKQLQTFSFPNDEGWGMTNDGTNLIYSDGTDVLYFMNPADFSQVKKIQVKDQYGPVTDINELEYIKGYIYANQWRADIIYKIDPATGNVVGIADMKNLRRQTGIPPMEQATDETQPEVMNGIAYDAATNRIFITGKNWPKIFEVKLDN
ncbi:hypothetical protein CAP35_15445 [Chitinophagaceae bacterium IBVUCB1]|nr:hypothetical protein CAP35_15445 [Chitinophagaceae bacterium IBVUCB1]